MAKCDDVYNQAVDAGKVDPQDRNLIYLEMHRVLNMALDAGRPSDAMRSVVRSYVSLGRDAYVKQWHQARDRA